HKPLPFAIPFFNFSGQLDLLLPNQQRDLPDFAQVNLNSGIASLSSHITLFHQSFGGFKSTTPLQSWRLCRSRVLPSWKYLTRLNIRNNDNRWMPPVQSFWRVIFASFPRVLLIYSTKSA